MKRKRGVHDACASAYAEASLSIINVIGILSLHAKGTRDLARAQLLLSYLRELEIDHLNRVRE